MWTNFLTNGALLLRCRTGSDTRALAEDGQEIVLQRSDFMKWEWLYRHPNVYTA